MLRWTLALALAGATLLATPPASAACVHETVGEGPIILANVTTAGPGPGPVCRTSVTAYACTARYFGGGGDPIGNFEIQCMPLVTLP
jgi:hypothetical protein